MARAAIIRTWIATTMGTLEVLFDATASGTYIYIVVFEVLGPKSLTCSRLAA